MTPVLSVRDLAVGFATDDGQVRAVDGVSFDVARSEVLAIVGESGCGKSVTAQTLMGLTRSPNAIISGSVIFEGRDLNTLPDKELQKIRGARIAMVFQDPMTSLNPVYRVGDQIAEAIRAHRDESKSAALERAAELLGVVGIPHPQQRVRDYPHEFSGGMRQRVMIAMALALEPDVLIADEPTTALDVTIQAQILDLLRNLNRDRGVSVVLITHDLGVVAELADRVLVMYAGQVVEQAGVDELFAAPQHPYTRGLLASIPRLDSPAPQRLPQIPGHPPSLLNPPTGCRFAARCPEVFDECSAPPPLTDHAAHEVRCWKAEVAIR
jgi:oligopeptide/dipeptide ABC transporter ATP-binding protein